MGFGESLGGFLGGLFGGSDKPYKDAEKAMQEYLNKAQGQLNPFINAGTGAMGNYQNWLKGMSDPSGFINNLMGKYQESPAAKYMKEQAMRAGTNAASAGGLTGSTPFAQQMAQTAGNISSGDMNNWLQNVLGINSQYGQGNAGLMGIGANAANSLANMFGQYGPMIGEQRYNQGAARNNDFWNMIGGGLGMLGSFF